MSTMEPDLMRQLYNISDLMGNLSWLFNASRNIDPALLDQVARNRSLDDGAFYSLIFIYSAMIVVGAAGNSLVVCAVVRKPAMRTARNMFIVNLAVSDLLLCLITMPLTLMEILTKYWPLGRHSFTCKMMGTLQATSIFVSTISITAIALDRYQVIVYPTRENLQKLGAVFILTCIWMTSLVLASPMFVWKTLKYHDINLPSYGIEYIAYCLEEWPVEHGRAYYSVFSLVVQYVLPIIIVSVSYSRICRKLRYRYVSSSAAGSTTAAAAQKRRPKDDRRMKKTNSLLVSIALIFCVSWMPLNTFNLVVDFYNPFGEDRRSMMVCYAVCHMMGMSSACSNPLLYGWLNDNFRKEFKEILARACPCVDLDAVRERVGSLRSSVSRGRRRLRQDGTPLRPLAGAEPETTACPASCRRGTITTDNGLNSVQGDSEMSVLTKM
ncbi:neuropeptide F receptor-like [Bacillus rossius redtenbacheri]|uniref:neuropeptide F receptor-like n=1 Tax=Bacillus rossius redtenbacheri TaxID=93214 RepID=UPI002FDDA38A